DAHPGAVRAVRPRGHDPLLHQWWWRLRRWRLRRRRLRHQHVVADLVVGDDQLHQPDRRRRHRLRPHLRGRLTALESCEIMAMSSANEAVVADQQIRMPKTGEVVAERLRRQIARGELTIGQRLPPEDELTAVFGIARTT